MAAPVRFPTITVITPCYQLKRLSNILELIDTLQNQTYKRIEIIIVTESSRELKDSIEAHVNTKGYSNVVIMHNEVGRGSYASRNLGIQKAKGDIIAFIDDDALPYPCWTQEMANTFNNDDSVIGLTGPILPLWEKDGMSWFPQEFYWIFACTYKNWDEMKEVRNGYATNLSFRREAFDRCGLFRTSLDARELPESDWQQPGGEETEFCLRVKRETAKRILYHPEVKVKHRVYSYRLSMRFITRRAYWEGYAKAILNRLYHSHDKRVLYPEYQLLRHILFRLIPELLKLIVLQPITTLRKLWITLLVILFVGLGYLISNLRIILIPRKNDHPID